MTNYEAGFYSTLKAAGLEKHAFFNMGSIGAGLSNIGNAAGAGGMVGSAMGSPLRRMGGFLQNAQKQGIGSALGGVARNTMANVGGAFGGGLGSAIFGGGQQAGGGMGAAIGSALGGAR